MPQRPGGLSKALPSLRPVDIADFSGNFRDTAEANAHNMSRT